MSLKYVQTLTLYQAGAGNIIGATSVVLTSLTDIYGNAITSMAPFGTTGYITLEPDTTNEEGAIFTGITVNANGTTTLTGISTILAQSPYTATSGLVRNHAGGSKVVVTDNVAFWNTFANINNDQTFAGANVFTQKVAVGAVTSSDLGKAATVDFVNATAVAGAPNASSTVKGIVQEATQAQVLAKTAAGSTGAELYINPATLASTLTSDYKVDTGSANAYAIAPAPAITAYTVGQIFSFKAVNANTTTSTLNVNGLGTQTIKNTKGNNLVANDIQAGQLVVVGYDGTNFIMLSPLGNVVSLSGGAYPAGSGASITGVTVTQVVSAMTAGASISTGKPVVVLPFPAADVTFDTKLSANGSSANTLTQAFTVASNSNRILIVAVASQGTSVHISGVTYAGVALANKVEVGSLGSAGDNRIAYWYLVAPTTGTNNLIFTTTGTTTLHFNIYSYYNVAQTSVPEASTSGTSGGGTASASLAPLTNGGLILGATYDGTPSGGAYTNNLLSNSTISSGDSGVLYPPAPQTMSETGGSNNNAVILISLQPVAAGATARVYTSSSAQAVTTNSFIGFAQTGVTVGQTVSVLTDGIDTNQSGLTVGAQYYLNDTSGNIGSSAGTVSRKVGIATSATSILVTNIW